jgi:hypothetical protein
VAGKKIVPNDPALLSREQTAEVLGCSEWQLRKLQANGLIPAVQVEGAYFFNIQNVQGLAKRQLEGSRAAQCFERFERGMAPERVVIELQMPYDEVERAHQAWVRMADAVVFRPTEGVSRKRWEQVYGVKVTPQNLHKALAIVATHADLCKQLEPLEQQGAAE